MRTASFTTAAAVFATLIATGCGSKQKAKTLPPTAQVPSTTNPPTALKHPPKVSKTERATGELREAMMHLRRIHFAYDTATILPDSRTALEEASEGLEANPTVHIYIDGHTDERGTNEYNLALGERRAHVIADYLKRLGIAAERLHVVTFGEEKPWATGESKVAYAKNRRAEFRLMRGDVRLVVDDGVLYDDTGKNLARANGSEPAPKSPGTRSKKSSRPSAQ